MLEVDRAVSLTAPNPPLVQALETMIGAVAADQSAFQTVTAEMRSSRVDDLVKSFSRLLLDLRAARTRLVALVDGEKK